MWKIIGTAIVLSMLYLIFVPGDEIKGGDKIGQRPTQETINRVMDRKAQRAGESNKAVAPSTESNTKPQHVTMTLDPYRLCQALAFNGYHYRQWKYLEGLGWGCSSDLQYNHTDGTLNEISFYIRSKIGERNTEHLVEKMEIQASIFDLSHTEKVKKEFMQKIDEFFSSSGLKEPEGLMDKVESETDFEQLMEYGKLTMIRENDYKIGYGLMIEIIFNPH